MSHVVEQTRRDASLWRNPQFRRDARPHHISRGYRLEGDEVHPMRLAGNERRDGKGEPGLAGAAWSRQCEQSGVLLQEQDHAELGCNSPLRPTSGVFDVGRAAAAPSTRTCGKSRRSPSAVTW